MNEDAMQEADTIDMPALPAPGETGESTAAYCFAAAEREARTIDAIAYCLRVWDVAEWAGWKIIRIPSTRGTVWIEATEACGTIHLKEYPARIGYPLPFDRMDVAKALVPYGAVLAR